MQIHHIIKRTKKDWRKALLDAREARSSQACRVEDRQIAGHLDAWVEGYLQSSDAQHAQPEFLVYWPWRGEPDLRELWRSWHSRGLRLQLPVVVRRDAPLAARFWDPYSDFVEDALGLPVPRPNSPRATEAPTGEAGSLARTEGGATVDLPRASTWIIPCVGVDAGGHRIGAGMGFYDRTLSECLRRGRPRPFMIGVCRSQAVVSENLAEPHDLRLDTVVTEHGFAPVGDS
ncbi:MAG: hypothetical protein RLY67_585 [Pseudomonadota bacterium]